MDKAYNWVVGARRGQRTHMSRVQTDGRVVGARVGLSDTGASVRAVGQSACRYRCDTDQSKGGVD